jgi:hypothetical protein
MPKNPSNKQRLASAKNLKGNYGPNTAAGKAKSALNGKKNKGPKTTKSRARIQHARWGIKDTFYALSGCLYCPKECPGKSFSRKAPISDYSFVCFQDIIVNHPAECFYHFHGLCGIRYDNMDLSPNYCILDDQNLQSFSPGADTKSRNKQELEYRKKFVKLKDKMEKFLSEMDQNKEPSPEMKSTFNELKNMFYYHKICNYTDIQPLDLEKPVLRLITDSM